MSYFTDSKTSPEGNLLLRMAEETLQFEYEGGAVTPLQYPHTSGWRTLSFLLIAYVDGAVDLSMDHLPICRARTGQVVCVQPGVHHMFEVAQRRGVRSIWSHVNFTISSTIAVTDILNPPLLIDGAPARKIREINRELADIANDRPPTLRHVFRRKALAFQLLLLITERAELRPGTIEYLRKLERLTPTLAYLKENFTRAIQLSDLAQMAKLSPSRFHALFEDALGQPPGRYLQNLRLQRARQLLLGESSVGEVAMASGYQDVFHFSRIFKKHFGVSPSHYRARATPGF